MVILAHSKVKNVQGSGNNSQLETNSGGLPHYQFQIKSGICADLIGLFSPVLSPALAKRVICARYAFSEILWGSKVTNFLGHFWLGILIQDNLLVNLKQEVQPVSQLLSGTERKETTSSLD